MRHVPATRMLCTIATSLTVAGLFSACSGGSGALAPSVPGGATTQSVAQGTAATQSTARSTTGTQAVATSTEATLNSQRQDITTTPHSLTFASPGGAQKFVASEDDDSKNDEEWRARAESSDSSVCTVSPKSAHAEDPHNNGHENIAFTVTAQGDGRCKVTVTDVSDSRHNTATVSVTVGTSSPQPTMSPSAAPSGSPSPVPSTSPSPVPSTSPSAKPSMSPTPIPSSSPTSPPSGCPNPGTTAPPQLSSQPVQFAVDGLGVQGQFVVSMMWTPNTYGVKVLESNTGMPGSFTDESGSANIGRFDPNGTEFPGPCVNGATFPSGDPLNNHSWRQAQTVYFEVETVNDTGVTGPPSNVVSFTIPAYNGNSGPIGVSQGAPGASTIHWQNSLQGYRNFFAHSASGPFSQQSDSGFTIDQEDVGFTFSSSDPPGTQECFEIQGYDQSGNLGPISSPACFANP